MLSVVGSQVISLPKGAVPLDVQAQHGGISMWVLLDTDEKELEPLTIEMFDTGADLGADLGATERTYITSMQLRDGGIVRHVFWRNAEASHGSNE